MEWNRDHRDIEIDVTLTPKGDVAKKKLKRLLIKAVESKMRLTKQYSSGVSSFWWMNILYPCPSGTSFEHHTVSKWNAKNDHLAKVSGTKECVRLQFKPVGDAVTFFKYLEQIAFTVEGTLTDDWGGVHQWDSVGWLLIPDNEVKNGS